MFDQNAILNNMETMRRPNGAFIASPTADYSAMWLRDMLYISYAYLYMSDHQKLREGIWVVFDVFKKYRSRLVTSIASPDPISQKAIHAKYDAKTLEPITSEWGHHQLDALGLFLFIVADLTCKNIPIIRDAKDREVLQLLVWYLRSVEYWHKPDFGLWEECEIRHSSSIGAVVAGLRYLQKQKLAIVPDSLIQYGERALHEILPRESRDVCTRAHHNHDRDPAQLSLVWPFKLITSYSQVEKMLARITDRLLQKHGINRFWGDDYYRSSEERYRGISAEWPMFLFWISIIYSQFHKYKKAKEWFCKGVATIVANKIPEAYQNGKPNDHTPLAWAHAIALIAFSELPSSTQQKHNPQMKNPSA